MILTIIHLTDIHLNTQNNYLDGKTSHLWQAVKSEVRHSDRIVCCVSGDIAQSGNESEYFNHAIPLFDNIRKEIKDEVNIDCDFLFIPGNHDCDFSNKDANSTRDILLRNIGSTPTNLSSHTIDTIRVQKNFDDFKELFHSTWSYCKLEISDQLVEKISLDLDDKKVVFNLYNSSWVSTIHEKPGQMFFPSGDYKEKMTNLIGDINVSLVHHPDHWLQPDNRREFKDLLESTSDFILSGHEHHSTHGIATDWSNKRIQYIEGGVLQENSDADSSAFNILHLDLSDNKQRIVEYKWESMHYSINMDTNWTNFFTETTIKHNSYSTLELKSDFVNFIDDLSIPLTHPRVSSPKLSDLYTYPNVKEIIYQNKQNEIIKYQEVTSILTNIKSQEHIVFSGDKESGKSSLGKIIFQWFFNKKKFPLLIDGSDIKPSQLKAISRIIEEGANKIYGIERVSLYMQLNRSDRVLVIDNWQNTRLNDKYKSKFLVEAAKWFDNVIFLTDGMSNIGDFIHLISEIDTSYSIRQFEIQELGFEKREELIEKWILLGQEESLEETEFIRLKDRNEKAINSIIGQNYVPTYPLYILIILQTLESGNTHNLDRSTNGYYYEVLIKQSLAKIQMSNEETDKMYNYMTEIAYKFFNENIIYLSEEGWIAFHEYYRLEYGLNPQQFSFTEFQTKLVLSKIFEKNNGGYRFSYPYIYYYFVAQYLAKYIQEDDCKNKVADMCRNLHQADFAHIIMFLTHLSKDRFIISKVIESTKAIFEDIPILKLEEDINVVNNLMDYIPQLVIGNINVKEHRKLENKKRDEFDLIKAQEDLEVDPSKNDDIDEEDESIQSGMELVNNLNKSFKMIEIIGQILKNYYGSTKATEKIELCNEAFEVALRTNNIAIISLNEDKEFLIRYISNIIKDRGFNGDDSQVEKISKRILYTMAKAITFSTIEKVSLSVGTRNLDEIFKGAQNTLPFTSVKLLNTAIKLEHYDDYPFEEISSLFRELKDNMIAKDLLQNLVGKYLYMFQTNYKEQQAICSSVGIKYEPKTLLPITNFRNRTH
ncbi:metallophosphoesterase [Neobacillus niacini]|uniref:metallophosphoesterase n=1 Tax=Neobacillus niacini TaxID=86668 RepID=UPI002FFF4612